MARRPRGQLRQDILETVITLLIDTGEVESVSIDAVVDKVGCTPPALYYYFPTKSDLLRQACAAEFQKLADRMTLGGGGAHGGSIATLVGRADALLTWAADHPALYRILFMGSGRADHASGPLDGDPSLRAVRLAIDEGIASGLVKPQDAGRLTLSLWGLAHGYAALAVTFPAVSLAGLRAAQALAVRAIAGEILTDDGRRALPALGLAEAGETAEPAAIARQ